MPELLVTDPSTGRLVGRLPCSDAEELVATSTAAHPGWARTSPGERGAALQAGARRLRATIDDVALLQTREGGKPLADSRGGWRRASAPWSSTPSLARSTAAGRFRAPGAPPTP